MATDQRRRVPVRSVVFGGRRKWVEGSGREGIYSRGRREGALQISPETEYFFGYFQIQSCEGKWNTKAAYHGPSRYSK
jgi:hypothetical protein